MSIFAIVVPTVDLIRNDNTAIDKKLCN